MSVAVHDPVAVCDAFADLLEYPRGDSAALACRAGELAEPAREPLAAFAAAIADRPLVELQELYTRTFDLNPSAALEVGWHLFGEDYARGMMLVRLRNLLAEHAVPETTELPDHLTCCLRLLGRLEPAAAAHFAAACLLPVLPEIRRPLDEADHPYARVLQAIQILLEARYAPLEPCCRETPHA